MTRKSLSDILHQGEQQSLSAAWETTEAAEDFGVLPAGEYVARIVSGELFTSKKGTPGYKLAFCVLEGDHAGRPFWDDIWLTPAALAMAKRDLSKLGIRSLEQLEQPLPPGIRCKVKLTLRREDDGTEFNRLKRFEVVGIDTPEQDAFAPQENPQSGPLPKGEGTGSPADDAGLTSTPSTADESAGGENGDL